MGIKDNLSSFQNQLPAGIKLVAVSKTKPVKIIEEAYNAGQRCFGENKVQEARLNEQKTELLSFFIGLTSLPETK